MKRRGSLSTTAMRIGGFLAGKDFMLPPASLEHNLFVCRFKVMVLILPGLRFIVVVLITCGGEKPSFAARPGCIWRRAGGMPVGPPMNTFSLARMSPECRKRCRTCRPRREFGRMLSRDQLRMVRAPKCAPGAVLRTCLRHQRM